MPLLLELVFIFSFVFLYHLPLVLLLSPCLLLFIIPSSSFSSSPLVSNFLPFLSLPYLSFCYQHLRYLHFPLFGFTSSLLYLPHSVFRDRRMTMNCLAQHYIIIIIYCSQDIQAVLTCCPSYVSKSSRKHVYLTCGTCEALTVLPTDCCSLCFHFRTCQYFPFILYLMMLYD